MTDLKSNFTFFAASGARLLFLLAYVISLVTLRDILGYKNASKQKLHSV